MHPPAHMLSHEGGVGDQPATATELDDRHLYKRRVDKCMKMCRCCTANASIISRKLIRRTNRLFYKPGNGFKTERFSGKFSNDSADHPAFGITKCEQKRSFTQM